MLSLAFLPVLAAGALAAKASTSSSPAYPAATESSNFIRLNINVTGSAPLAGAPFPYDNNANIHLLPATTDFGSSRGQTWCSGQVVFTRSQGLAPSTFYVSPHNNHSGGAPILRGADYSYGVPQSYVLHIATVQEADAQGRRSVNQTTCAGQKATTGVHVETSPFAHLTYDDNKGFGAWYVCWVTEEPFGPSLFYRSKKETTPAGCSEAVLISSCSGPPNDGPFAGIQETTACYSNPAEV